MTQEQRAEINKQNAAHSTGPKTEEGKAKSAKNAATHGLTSSKPPLENPDFIQLHNEFLQERNPQTPTQHLWVLELAHIAFKLKQIPSLEFEVELISDQTLAEQFAQDKPTPLSRLWNLQLRLSARFDSLVRKLSAVDVPSTEHPSAPTHSILQNEPLGAPSSSSGPSPSTPMDPILQIEPTPSSLLQSMHSILNANPGMADRLLQNKAIPQDLRDFLNDYLRNEPTPSPSIPIPSPF